jgi:hypothetical protein
MPALEDHICLPNSRNDSFFRIVQDLESIRDFPSTMLFPDTKCISAIRASLQLSKLSSGPSTSTKVAQSTSPFSHGVDWRPRYGHTRRRITLASHTAGLHRKRSSGMPKPCPTTLQSLSNPGRLSSSWDAFTASFKQPQSLSLPQPNTQPICNIFPQASVKAIYPHILAMTF